MHLLEIETRHWRGLSQKIGPLSERLNAVFGPNESGKSRLFQALRFSLFESYKGNAQHKTVLQSRNSVESPWVRISFDVDGKTYELTKQFLKGGFAELTGGGATLRNEDAETRVRQLIGTRAGGSREVGPEDLGIWPLLMVRQGASGTIPGSVLTDDSRSKIQARLAGEIGAAAISESGAKLLELAQAEHERFFTATSGQENTTLKAARTRLETALTRQSAEQAAYAKQIETSARLTDARKDWTDLQGRVNKAKGEVASARTTADAAQNAAAKLKASRTQHELRKTQEDRARREKDAVLLMLDQSAKLQGAIGGLDVEISNLVASETQLSDSGATLREAVKVANDELGRALEVQGRARKAAQRQRLVEQKSSLDAVIDKLEDVGRRLDEANKAKGKIVPVSDAQLQKLRDFERAVRDAEARLAGAAVRVTVTPEVDLVIDGASLRAGEARSLDVVEDRTIRLEGIASVVVRPSLGSLDELIEQASQAQQELKSALDAMGLDSVAAAIEAHRRGKELAQELALIAREASVISPRKLSELHLERQGVAEQLAQDGNVECDISLDAAIEAAERAGAALDAARGDKARNDNALSDLRVTLTGKRSSRVSANAQLTELTQQLAERRTESELEAELQEAQAKTREASADLSIAQDAYDNFGGDQAAEDLKRLERAAENLSTRLTEARGQVDKLQGSLQTMMTEGSYEKMVDAEAEVVDAQTQLDRVLKQAAAAKRLFTLLSTERRKVVEQMTAPVIARIRPYLADIFPGSQLVTGENLEFDGLHTQNMQEDFASLSGGAQEQLALMTRIGIAEVLAGDGRLPLILDDSLVNSDPERVRMVHRALDRAGKTLQIILMSCQEVLYDELGADYQVRLERVRRG